MSGVPPVVWTPSAKGSERAAITSFTAAAEARAGRSFGTYEELHRWSVDDLDAFWDLVWSHFDVVGERGDGPALADAGMPGATWFPGATLNWAEHVLRPGADEDVALVAVGEEGPARSVTRGELREQVARAAAGLRRLGVGRGDAVVAYLPNVPEAVVAVLACASIGALFSSCSPDFGTRSVIDRFAQLAPKVLLAVDGYRYGGKAFDRLDVLAELRAALPSVEHTVLLPVLGGSGLPVDVVLWAELLAEAAELDFAPLPFDHALWVLWSSGTTGLPKGLVHGHGGIVLEHLKQLRLHCDLGPEDRLLWFTTTGWMMWNFLLGALMTGASVVLQDGNPAYPSMERLWDVAEEQDVTVFGTSAAWVHASIKAAVRPRDGRPLSRLRAVGSTGSPLSPDGFAWLADELESPWVFSISGGSDVCSAFVGGLPTLPVHVGELQCRSLGAVVEAWDEDGHPVVDEVGELVLTRPMPSMPVALVGDLDGERYRAAYFEPWPGVWRHGDWITLTARGSAVIHGRSDATINRGGVRMGTAEIYAAVLADPDITDAVVVDLPEGDASSLLLFVVLTHGVTLDDALRRRLTRSIREGCSPRHVPDEVVAVPEVPRTLSGKVVEIPVKRILGGTAVERAASVGALANPASLDWFARFGRDRTPSPA